MNQISDFSNAATLIMFLSWVTRGHPDIPIPYVLLPVIPLPDIPIPDMPKRKIGISIMFDVFLPNIPIPDIYTGF